MVDAILLEEILSHIHNWFDKGSEPQTGTFTVTDGAMASASIPEGAWYRVQGSYLNDGLHLHPASDLTDEEFEGTVTVLRIPRPLLALAEEIAAWREQYGTATDGPYQSESFGGYSYTMKSDSSSQNGSGGLTGWRLAFRDRLSTWRKIS
jgi:hypothetical protein